MTALGPKARELIETARSEYRPQSGDRARIAEALRARLGADALPVDVASPALQPLSGWSLLGGGALGVCLGASVALWAMAPAHAPQPRAAEHALSAPTFQPPTVTVVTEPAREIEAPAPETPTPSVKPRIAARAHMDSLSQEVALLSRATREIGAGRASKALSALAEHQQRFPNGKLSEERRAAKAQALCALGHIAEGREEQAQLAPQSPAAARAKQACDKADRARAR